MQKTNMLRLLTFVGVSAALSSCQTGSAIDGSGFVLETPNAHTRSDILKNDPDFALQVAGNREICLKLAGCKK
jgi:hypothetical protein